MALLSTIPHSYQEQVRSFAHFEKYLGNSRKALSMKFNDLIAPEQSGTLLALL
jgi:hypothetical protein